MSTVATARKLALSFPGASEEPHFHRASFRVAKRIFATLDAPRQKLVVKLSQADRTSSIEMQPEIFHDVGWAHQGWTGVNLPEITDTQLESIIELAWKNVAPSRKVRAYEEK